MKPINICLLEKLIRIPALVVGLAASNLVQSAVVVNALEVGNDVIFETEAGGSLDLFGLTLFDANSSCAGGLSPSDPTWTIGSGGGCDSYTGIVSAPSAIGPGGFTNPSSTTGDVLFFTNGSTQIKVNDGYTSGSLISGTTTYDNQTIGSLGLTTGTYVFTLPSDTVTLNVGTVVPLPSAVWFFASALGIVAGARKRSNR